MTRSSIRPFLLVLSLLLIQPATAHAQYGDSWGIPWNNPVSATLSTNVWNNWTIYQLQQRKAHGAAAGSSQGSAAPRTATPAPAPPARPDTSYLRFRPSGTRLTATKLADQIGSTPAEKQQLAADLNTIYQAFDQQAARLGKPNDLGLALSYFLAQNTVMYRSKPDPTDAQFVELSNVLSSWLAENGALKNLTNQQKQELYETLVAFTGLAQAGYQQAMAQGNQENLQAVRHLAGVNLKSITHIAPDRFDFTEQGLTIQPQ